LSRSGKDGRCRERDGVLSTRADPNARREKKPGTSVQPVSFSDEPARILNLMSKQALLVSVLLTAGCSGFAAPSPTPAPPTTVVAPVVETPREAPAPSTTVAPLQVRITGAPSLMVGVPATFTAQSTFETSAVSYRWTFSDGSGTEANASAAGTHTFGWPGMATVTVTASDERGEVSDSLQSMVMAPPTPTPPKVTPPPPPATFVVTLTCTANPPLSSTPCNVASSWNGAAVPSTSVTFVTWDWGDGAKNDVMVGPIRQHNYAQAGTFYVVATVSAQTAAGLKTGTGSLTLAIK
jgi:hypothetical protein